MSFGKFLELSFYNSDVSCRTDNCNHSVGGLHMTPSSIFLKALISLITLVILIYLATTTKTICFLLYVRPQIMRNHVRFFRFGNLLAIFKFENAAPFTVNLYSILIVVNAVITINA
jgi:hypothetical protein